MTLSIFPTHLVLGPDSCGVACCDVVRDGQTFLVRCETTGAEMIWSPGEQGTLDVAVDEHTAAHLAMIEAQRRQRDFAADVAHARWVYRNTEPNSPLRRGINAYAAFL